MAQVSGQYGQASVSSSELIGCDGWTLNKAAVVSTRATSADAGWKVAVAGTKSGTGTIKGPWDSADPADDHVDVGTSVSLKLYTTATAYYSLTAIISEFTVEVDIDNGEIVGWNASFTASGAITNPT